MLSLIVSQMRKAVLQISRDWNNNERTDDDNEGFSVRIERLLSMAGTVQSCYGEVDGLAGIVQSLSTLYQDLRVMSEKTVREIVSVDISGKPGRPKFDIPSELLHFYLEHNFNASQIAKMLNVSKSTIKRRLKQNDIRISDKYTEINDDDLDISLLAILHEFPNTGYKKMKGYLSAKGLQIQEYRIRESMRRVDPEGVILRGLQSRPILRRKYSVAGPLSLFHMDGNHKLIRYDIIQSIL